MKTEHGYNIIESPSDFQDKRILHVEQWKDRVMKVHMAQYNVNPAQFWTAFCTKEQLEAGRNGC